MDVFLSGLEGGMTKSGRGSIQNSNLVASCDETRLFVLSLALIQDAFNVGSLNVAYGNVVRLAGSSQAAEIIRSKGRKRALQIEAKMYMNLQTQTPHSKGDTRVQC